MAMVYLQLYKLLRQYVYKSQAAAATLTTWFATSQGLRKKTIKLARQDPAPKRLVQMEQHEKHTLFFSCRCNSMLSVQSDGEEMALRTEIRGYRHLPCQMD